MADNDDLINDLQTPLYNSYSPPGWYEKYTRYEMFVSGRITQDCLKKLYNWIDDTLTGPNLSPVRLTQLTVGVILETNLGNFTLASNHLTSLEKFTRLRHADLTSRGLHDRADAFKYVLLTTQAYYALKMNDTTKARERWEKSKLIDISRPGTAAMLLVFHAQFTSHCVPGGADRERAKDLQTAVGLDESNGEAVHYLCRAHRKIRRELGGPPGPTSLEEKRLTNALSHLDLQYLPQNELDVLQWYVDMKNQMGSTAAGKTGSGSQYGSNENRISLSSRVAKILRMTNPAAAEKEFNQLLQKWPNNSEVLHKAGSFFTKHYTLLRNPQKYTYGLQLIRQSILNHGDINYSGLFEWMDKIWRRDGMDGLEEILDLAGDCLNKGTHSPHFQTTQLQLLLGTILWATGEQQSAFNLFTDTFLENHHQLTELQGTTLADYLVGERVMRSLLSSDQKWELLHGLATHLQSQIQAQELKNNSATLFVSSILSHALSSIISTVFLQDPQF